MRGGSLLTVIATTLTLLTAGGQAEEGKSEFPRLRGPYLGQKTAGNTAAIFAPGVVPVGGVCSGFMNEGEFFIFKMLSPDLDWKFEPVYVTEFTDDSWTEPAIAPLGGLYPYNYTVAPDGRTLYFTSVRAPVDHEGWHALFHELPR